MLSSNSVQGSDEISGQNKYKGVRCRKWGKWVSEIRVPGTRERLWLGSYNTPEAAAVSHDVASYCLRGPPSMDSLNFPLMLPASAQSDMSPKSIQRVASDAGMAVDAQMILSRSSSQAQDVRATESGAIGGKEIGFREDGVGPSRDGERKESGEGQSLSISVEDYFF